VTVFVRPLPFGHTGSTGADRAPIQPLEATELNYGLPPQRVFRTRSFNLAYYAGLMQWGMQQWFYQAFLPPPLIPRVSNSVRAIGGIMGANTVGQATSHVPSARVPRSVT